MSQSRFIIHYKGQLVIDADSQDVAEEAAMEMLPEETQIIHTEFDGDVK